MDRAPPDAADPRTLAAHRSFRFAGRCRTSASTARRPRPGTPHEIRRPWRRAPRHRAALPSCRCGEKSLISRCGLPALWNTRAPFPGRFSHTTRSCLRHPRRDDVEDGARSVHGRLLARCSEAERPSMGVRDQVGRFTGGSSGNSRASSSSSASRQHVTERSDRLQAHARNRARRRRVHAADARRGGPVWARAVPGGGRRGARATWG